MKGWQVALMLLVVGLALAVGGWFFLDNQRFPESSANEPVAIPFDQQQTVTVGDNQITAETFTTAFYTWYLQGLSGNIKFTTTSQFASDINQWLTPSFISKLGELASSTGGNPILLAQDYLPSWVSNIKSTAVNQSGDYTQVIVTLGIGTGTQKIRATLTRSSNAWRINSITPIN